MLGDVGGESVFAWKNRKKTVFNNVPLLGY